MFRPFQPSRRRARRPASPPPPPVPVRRQRWVELASAEAALDVIGAVLADNPDAGCVALIENRIARRGFALPVIGAPPDGDALHELDAVLIAEAQDLPGSRLVLVSVRPPGPPVVEEADIEHWRRLCARHQGEDLALVDWFILLGDEYALSMAELAGPHPDWPG